MLQKHAAKKYKVETIDPEKVTRGDWQRKAKLFVMPGGADIPYGAALNGKGNANIKNFVNKGGAYLGICAGAYYGSESIEFAKGTCLEVVGKRELAFFPGLSVGPFLAVYDYASFSGARAATLADAMESHGAMKPVVYYNGGGYFQNAEKHKNVRVLWRYDDPERPAEAAIIRIQQGHGVAVLSGVHFEFDPGNMTPPHPASITQAIEQSNPARVKLIKNLLITLGVDTHEAPGPASNDGFTEG